MDGIDDPQKMNQNLTMTKKECSVEDCSTTTGKFHSGMCSMHYQRKRRHGDPMSGRSPNGARAAFLKHAAAYDGDDCLFWPFPDTGYGGTNLNGTRMAPSRAVCVLRHGPPPFPKADAAHSCANGHKRCVNPNHLRWATRLENVRDMEAHGTKPLGDGTSGAKLTNEQALAVFNDPRGYREIAAEYGITRSAVGHIKTGAHWSWLTGKHHTPQSAAA